MSGPDALCRGLLDAEAAAGPIEPRLTVTKLTQHVPVSAELLREPTDAERAVWAAERIADEQRHLVQRDVYAAAINQATGQLLREVLHLHQPAKESGRWVCIGCDFDLDGEPPEWPCRTARLALPNTDERNDT